MQITDIQQQKRTKNRFSVFIDKKYAFSLDIDQLEEVGLNIGDKIDASEMARLKKQSGYGKLFERALRQLARRPRSEWEMRDYLRRKEAAEQDIEKIVSKLKKLNYLNDTQFAESWVRSRRALKATSKRRLRQELLKKRVDNSIINQVLAEDETDEQSVLIDLIQKKRNQTRYQDDQKLIAYLQRQGFNYSDIRTALDEVN